MRQKCRTYIASLAVTDATDDDNTESDIFCRVSKVSERKRESSQKDKQELLMRPSTNLLLFPDSPSCLEKKREQSDGYDSAESQTGASLEAEAGSLFCVESGAIKAGSAESGRCA